MTIYGLTGSIGMGKSFVAGIFQELGVPLFDADKESHKLLLEKSPIFNQLIELFPDALDESGTIDRKNLGRIVFFDEKRRIELEKIMHAALFSRMVEFINLNKSCDIVLEIPLLLELGWQKYVDKVIVVTAPYVIQKQRVIQRPGMSEEQFTAILALQMPEEEKIKRADIVLDTSQDYSVLKQNVVNLIKH